MFWIRKKRSLFRNVLLALLSLGLNIAGPHSLAGQSGPTLVQPSPSPSTQNPGEHAQASVPQSGAILGTVTDINDDAIPGAAVRLHGLDSSDVILVSTNDSGFFEIQDVAPGPSYHLTVRANGFASWESPVIRLEPGQSKIINVSKLPIEEVETSVVVTPEESEEIAVEEVKGEEKQRGFLIIPNFYEAYSANSQPLTARLKFSLALKVARDPFTLGGVTTLAGIDQAVNDPKYVQGAKGFAERLGANYANAFTAIMIDGAILPTLLHQDPRYFYQGKGTRRSRALHAMASLFIAKGDNGRWQPNYSGLGGDLASAAISNLYYPKANRGGGLVLQGFATDTAVHLAIRLLGEFAFHPPKN